jgi:hypothetical protein
MVVRLSALQTSHALPQEIVLAMVRLEGLGKLKKFNDLIRT